MLRQLLLMLQWLCLATFLSAQSAPSLTVKGDTTLQLGISDLQLEVKIVGNIATTTMGMRFYNPFDRILEGELAFPLAEGQTVSRYAMDVNGKLREGVIVEKQQGRQAFERIIRQKIDPGLLEMTEGNNFRTRVYPIPARGYKQIVLAYEQELNVGSSGLNYLLPLNFKEAVQNFTLSVIIFSDENVPVFIEPNDLSFTKKDAGTYIATFQATNYLPNRDFWFSIPKKVNEPQIFYEQKNKATYFYAILPIAPPAARFDKKLPKNIALYWDVSASAVNRDLKKELQLLEAYLKTIQACKIQVITFSNAIHLVKTLEIKNGDTDEIRQFLTAQAFDGGTQLGVLDFTKYKADEILLFTDGLSNFGNAEIKTSKTPVYSITSSATANPAYLKNLAAQTGGQYLNLQQKSVAEALENLTIPPFQFVKADFSTQALEEIFPSMPTIANGQFTFAGKLKQPKATITLHFGYGNRTAYTQKLELTKPTSADSSNVSRIWANKKLSELDQQFDKNKAAITALGKEFSIVTRNTSLIVLDRVEDYVTYEIVPPVELQVAYYKLLEERKKQRSEEDDFQEEINDEITDAFEELSEWWEEDFPKKVAPPKPQPAVQPPTPQPVPSPPAPQPTVPKLPQPIIPDSTKTTNIPLSDRIITGTILDADLKEPLIGANVLVVGTRVGTVTDVDGKYSIQLPVGATELEFSYTGYNSQLVVLGTSNVVNAQMEAGAALEEIVVVGYSSSMKKSLTASIAKIEIQNFSNALQGTIAGVQIVENDEGNTTAFVSSAGTIPFDSIGTYLLLIDNYVATAEDFEEVENDIVKIDFIEGTKATAMYGAKAAKGAILVQTRDQDFEPADSQQDTVVLCRASSAYLDSLQQARPETRFATYLRLKEIFLLGPTFYYDIANFFFTNKQRAEGLRVLSNIAELDLENAELLRILGHALQQQGEYKMAVNAFQKVAEWRPEEPQSYRDLGLALEKAGQYQQALDMLYKVLKDFSAYERQFSGIEGTLLLDINGLIAKHKKSLDLAKIDTAIIKPMPVDIRVVLNWSSDMTDVDLHVIEPNAEECFYSHSKTKIGGFLYDDITEGYGPEQYCLKKAIPGTYKIRVNLYSDNRQRLIEGIVFQAYVYLYYGTPKQKEYTTTIRLSSADKKVDIMEFRFE